MRAPEDVRIHHLVMDSGGFIRNAPLIDIAAKIYTIHEVIDEIKDKETRHRVKAYPFEINYREPSAESIRAVLAVSKKTGDYASLSVTDLKLLALAHDLHVEHCGSEGIVYDVKPKVPIWEETSKKRHYNNAAVKSKSEKVEEKMEQELAKETDNNDVGVEQACENMKSMSIENDNQENDKSEPAVVTAEADITEMENVHDAGGVDSGNEDEESEEDDDPEKQGRQRGGFGSWIDESNLVDVVGRLDSGVDPEVTHMKVACMTTDFPLQNVLRHMKLNLASIDGLCITRLRTFILRCRICKKTTPLITKQFCPSCGHQSLHKVGMSVDKFGNQKIHINKERERVTRGYRFPLPTPKGGKHNTDIRVTEDHMMPQNRMAKIVQDPISEAPFLMKDVTSRSALINARGYTRHSMPRNPNELRGGKKRGGKKR